jgi:ABC-type antimicrobial peptide transport system permease subunit
VGLVLGLVAAAAARRLLDTLAFGVGTVDVSSVLAVVTLVVVALIACAIPAWRATKVDPVIALRTD